MKGGDLKHRLTYAIDNERVTIIHTSKWRYCTQNDERRHFNFSFRITHRIWTNINNSRIRRNIKHIKHICCPIRSIMNELQSFTPRNEGIVLKTTNGGVLTLLFALLIEMERISIIPVLDRVSWKLYISRSNKCTYRIQNDERRRFNTSVVQFDQYWTSYNHLQL